MIIRKGKFYSKLTTQTLRGIYFLDLIYYWQQNCL
jgi:hypothetical protein